MKIIHQIVRTITVSLVSKEEERGAAPIHLPGQEAPAGKRLILGVKIAAREPEWFGNCQLALYEYTQRALEVCRTETDFFITLGKALEAWETERMKMSMG